MKNKRDYIIIIIIYEIIYLTLRYVLSMQWVTSTILTVIISFSIIYLDAEYYFLPTSHRKTMKAMDKTMEEIKHRWEEEDK